MNILADSTQAGAANFTSTGLDAYAIGIDSFNTYTAEGGNSNVYMGSELTEEALKTLQTEQDMEL